MNDIAKGTSALLAQEGAEYTAGFLCSQLEAVIAMLPKSKQKMAIAGFRAVVGQKVRVKVRSLMSDMEVEIPWDQVGGPNDPSTERYWTM